MFYSIKRSDTKKIAKLLLDTLGSIDILIDGGIPKNCQIKGLGVTSINFLEAVAELVKRYEKQKAYMYISKGVYVNSQSARAMSMCMGDCTDRLGISYVGGMGDIVHTCAIPLVELEDAENLFRKILQGMIQQNVRRVILGRLEHDDNCFRPNLWELASIHKISQKLKEYDFEIIDFLLIYKQNRFKTTFTSYLPLEK